MTCLLFRPNLLALRHEPARPTACPSLRRRRSPSPSLAQLRESLAVYLQAGVDRLAAWLFVRTAAGAVGSTLLVWIANPASTSHHRPVRAGRHAYTLNFSGRRWSMRCMCRSSPINSPPARLAGVLATAADRRDLLLALTTRRARRCSWRSRAPGRGDVVDADIVVDAFRVESCPRRAGRRHGILCRGYRIGMLVSTGGALFMVSAFESTGIRLLGVDVGYVAMAPWC